MFKFRPEPCLTSMLLYTRSKVSRLRVCADSTEPLGAARQCDKYQNFVRWPIESLLLSIIIMLHSKICQWYEVGYI